MICAEKNGVTFPSLGLSLPPSSQGEPANNVPCMTVSPQLGFAIAGEEDYSNIFQCGAHADV